MLTQQELKRVLNYEPDTGLWCWRVQTSKRVDVGDSAGYRRSDGYLCIRIHGKLYLGHRLAWLYVYGVWPPSGIDHIDVDKSNCRISNLRLATQSENGRNHHKRNTNTSGYRGVHFDKRRKKWMAFISTEKKRKHVGYFETAESANEARIAAAIKLHGEFARID